MTDPNIGTGLTDSVKCEATSVAAFVQQIAVAWVARGYWFYVCGEIPPHKDPRCVDGKFVRVYDIGVSKWVRARRIKRGKANVQYLRCGRFFALLATPGAHLFFNAEAGQIRDIRKEPLKFAGYSIHYKVGGARSVVSVRIERKRFRALKRHFSDLAVRLSVDELALAFRAVPFEPYAPVRKQLCILLRTVNRIRHVAGMEEVPFGALRLKRKSRKVFVQTSAKRTESDAASI